MTIRTSEGLFQHVLIYMGDTHLILPALNLSTLDAGILIMVQEVAQRILVSAPVPLELIRSFNWIGIGHKGPKGLRTGLDNSFSKLIF